MKKFLARRHRLLLFLPLYLAYVLVLFWRCELSDLANPGHDAVRLLAPLIELGLASTACRLCVSKARQGARMAWLALGALIAGTICVAYLAQTVSLYLSNNFVSVLALKNTDSAGFVVSPALGALVLAVACLYVLFVTGMTVATGPGAQAAAPDRKAWRSILAGVLVVMNIWLLLLQQKEGSLEAAFWQVPAASLASNIYTAQRATDFSDPTSPTQGNPCFTYSVAGPKGPYVFQKTSAYTDPLPFPSLSGRTGQPNVIVVFAEGTSARLVGAYGGAYPDLTPHIDRLARTSMQVENYFNHTAATYRGIIGQLTSGYTFAGGGGDAGWEHGDNKSVLSGIRRQTLARILGERGYDTYFFSPHPDQRPFTLMLRSLGFDRVYTYESIGQELLHGNFRAREHTGALEDQSLFAGIVEFLKQRAADDASRPFFLATYNIGTHAFIDVNKEGDVPYRDGKQPILNKVHNFDAALGQFLDYFYASPFARNTVLVFTSDHATYPDPTYREVAGKGLKPYFVDRIPLLVRDPINRLPGSLDAQGRNSLALAPTILQMLGVRDAPNSFLGNSLFERRNFPLGVAALGNSYYLTTPQGVFTAKEVPAHLKAQFKCETRVIRQFYAAEQGNRLVSPATDLATTVVAERPRPPQRARP